MHRRTIFADWVIEHKAELFSLIISLEMWDHSVPINRVKGDLIAQALNSLSLK
jgi:hypothetical protein